jgi:hypothetical protein
MDIMQKQLDLLDHKYKNEQIVLKNAPPPVKLSFDSRGHPMLQYTHVNNVEKDVYLTERDRENYLQSLHLKKLEDEYLQSIGKKVVKINIIDKYKNLLSYETNRLTSTREDFVHYVEEKGKEVHELKDQIARLKSLAAETDKDMNSLTKESKLKPLRQEDDRY